MLAIRDALCRFVDPPARPEAAVARQQAERVMRAAAELRHPDVLAGLVRNVKGEKPRSSSRPRTQDRK